MESQEQLQELKKISREDGEKYMKENVESFVQILTGSILPELRYMLTVLDSAKPCKQFQLAIMDVDSMSENLASINEDGYLPRLMEIPLEQSEINEQFSFEE